MKSFLQIRVLGVRILACTLLASGHSSALGDRCTCTTTSGGGLDGAVTAYEPAQRAMILWNGHEEILVLSTDLAYAAPSGLREVIPLPAKPVAQVADLSLYSQWADLMAPKGLLQDWLPAAPASAITAPLTIVNMGEPGFRLPPDGCNANLTSYKGRGYGWLVYDEVSALPTSQSFSPIEYRFQSGNVYYPLAISVGDFGMTQVDLFVITLERLSWFSTTEYRPASKGLFELTSSELSTLSTDWANFMSPPGSPLPSRPSMVVQHLRINGDIRRMEHDFLAH